MTALLTFVLDFATHWAYCEIARWLRHRETDRVARAFFRQDERVVSGVREMQR